MMFSRFLLVLVGAAGALADLCPGASTVTVLRTTTVSLPATSFVTIGSTATTVTSIFAVFSTQVTTSVVTTYTGSTSTSYLFLPGGPTPVKHGIEGRAGCNADNCLRALRATKVLTSAQAFCSTYTRPVCQTTLPAYIPAECDAPRISSACSCLPSTTACSTPTATSTVTISVTKISTSTAVGLKTVTSQTTVTIPTTSTAVLTTAIHAPPTVQTVYPCPPNPVNNQGPTYGDYHSTSDLGLTNNIYYTTYSEGASAQACCNTCFFGIQNCVQAYWYSYEGCVVSQAMNLSSGSGTGITAECPAGVFNGLTYRPDVSPAFRSTGNIAGPCGVSYSNF